jgi:hypothetical protein
MKVILRENKTYFERKFTDVYQSEICVEERLRGKAEAHLLRAAHFFPFSPLVFETSASEHVYCIQYTV